MVKRPEVKAFYPTLRTLNACWHKWVLRVLSSTELTPPQPEANFKQLYFIPTYVPSLEFGSKLLLFYKPYLKKEASLLLIYLIFMSAVFIGASANHSHNCFQMISECILLSFPLVNQEHNILSLFGGTLCRVNNSSLCRIILLCFYCRKLQLPYF